MEQKIVNQTNKTGRIDQLDSRRWNKTYKKKKTGMVKIKERELHQNKLNETNETTE